MSGWRRLDRDPGQARKGEIDFVLPDAYIQATIELTDENRERELGPFELVRTGLGEREEAVLSPDDPPPWL